MCVSNPLYDVELPFHSQQRGGNHISFRRIYPSFPITTNAAAGNNNMTMYVPFQIASERMHNDYKARRHARTLRHRSRHFVEVAS